MKLSDYVTEQLVQHGVRDLFTVSGGGIMHLLDSAGREPRLRVWCQYNEQACTIAAESNARIRGTVGAALVTTGPGSTNALTGVACAFVDSVPMIVVAGQVRRDLIADYERERQLGPQEINIDAMVRPIVKYAAVVTEPAEMPAIFNRAVAKATSGRPGPVWVSIPLDVQAAELGDPVSPCASDFSDEMPLIDVHLVESAIALVEASERPILIAGNGIHLAHAEEALERFIARTQIPALVTINAVDLLDEDHPLALGRFGPTGQRRANFALQNADLVLSIGASMAIAAIGFNTKEFAPKAKRIMVDVDQSQLDKSNYIPDLKIRADAGQFVAAFLARSAGASFQPSRRWLEACASWKVRYPVLSEDHFSEPTYVNTYVFVDKLSRLLYSNDVVVTGNSLDIVSVQQAFRVKKGQRVFTNANFGPMGWDLPAAVGCAAARDGGRVICLTGDGTLQFNSQELLTIGYYKMNVKIFVINNEGYDSIRSTQRNYFEGRFVGSSFDSGIGNPNFEALAAAYGLGYSFIGRNDDIDDALPGILRATGPQLCELRVAPSQGRSPRVVSFRNADGSLESKPLHDMYPFLPAEEVRENMTLFDEQPI